MTQWYCQRYGQSYGPMPIEQLRQWLTDRRIESTDPVWRDGMPQWLPASQVPELNVPQSAVAIAHPAVHPGYTAMPVHPMQTAPQESHSNAVIALLLWFFLGFLGIHRFYVGKIGTGIVWLLTGGLCGIGTFVDGVLFLFCAFNDSDGRRLQAAKAASIIILVFLLASLALFALLFGSLFALA